MAELNFRINVAPLDLQYKGYSESDLKLKIAHLQNYVKTCGLSVTMFDIAKLNRSEDADYPEIEELVVDVQSKSYSTNQGKTFLYQQFCQRWHDLTNSLSVENRPMLIFHDKESFIKTRSQCHENVSCKRISFGTLPIGGLYIEYSKLSLFILLKFSHDLRELEISLIKEFALPYKMVVAYSNIRKIVISNNKSVFKLFLDLFHPPLFFLVEQKRTREGVKYEIKYRIPGIDVNILGKANVIELELDNINIAEEIVSRLHFRCGKLPVRYVCITSVSKQPPSIPLVDFPHFGCTYLLTGIFNRNFAMIEQSKGINHSINILREHSIENGDCLEKALTIVLSAIDSGKVINYWDATEHFYQYYLSNQNEINFKHYIIPAKSRSIRRIMLTPTRMLLWPPEYMSENRVLRRFNSEYALRVNFRDDNISRLSWNALYASDEIFEASITHPMRDGIVIGSRKFEFLAWSNSQIRDHGVWMYAKDDRGTTVQDIRQWMGDFSHIHTVSKYMARMGQCFSQTEDAISVPLDEKYVKTEDDIEHGLDITNYKPYCFSDGIGKISTELAKKVHDSLGHDKLCSAFQIRYGGYKGMLVVDPTLKDTDIVFRKSMKKFDSPQNIRLEIARTSAPSSLQMNRPFITILNDMGVRHRTFLKLQEGMLRLLTDMLIDEEKAATYLKSKTPSGIIKYKELSESGISLTTEPFFRCLLLALHRHHVESIKTRANIAIDPSQGRNMLGVLDETGKLFYGEVFVQYTIDVSLGETSKDTKILKGTVLVTKNPCTHPGDVRKFKAVDIPELHHITDCIVFPQNGQRPHPNEMAGSDLDGDEYAVLWNNELIFHRENQAPAHYPASQASEVSNITVDHMIAFLVQYIKDDQIGVIANAHLAHADRLDIFSPTCLSISKKCSVAVDFAKNGTSAHLEVLERPQMFPDFMEKNYKVTYNSNKALGKMFRICKDFESENVQASMAYPDVKVDPQLIYPGWNNFEEDAIKSRNKYNSLLKSVLQTYGIQHEAEAFSGAFTNLHCRYQERKDRAEIEKVVVGCIKALSKNMLAEFLNEFSSSNFKTDVPRMLQKASAWYIVTYREASSFLSFAWVVSKYLANIKLLNTASEKRACFSPIVLKMDNQINESAIMNRFPVLAQIPKNLLMQYDFLCHSSIVEKALSVLIIWAQDEGIVEVPGYSSKGFLYLDVFIKLILHVAEKENYIHKKDNYSNQVIKQNPSSASLCLAFLRYCVTLRFYNKYEVGRVLPFQVFNYKMLSERAMVTYHGFALSGQFPALRFEPDVPKDTFEMKPIHIESKIFLITPIKEDDLRKAETYLVNHSNVKWVTMREIHQTKKIIVSAEGTEMTVKMLKAILRKKHVVLQEFFKTGILPE